METNRLALDELNNWELDATQGIKARLSRKLEAELNKVQMVAEELLKNLSGEVLATKVAVVLHGKRKPHGEVEDDDCQCVGEIREVHQHGGSKLAGKRQSATTQTSEYVMVKRAKTEQTLSKGKTQGGSRTNAGTMVVLPKTTACLTGSVGNKAVSREVRKHLEIVGAQEVRIPGMEEFRDLPEDKRQQMLTVLSAVVSTLAEEHVKAAMNPQKKG